MLPVLKLNTESGIPLYRQLYEQIKRMIESGALAPEERLPATRELAGHIGLNRTTITAAYELLETEGWIRRHVGRGSFVAGVSRPAQSTLRWQDLFAATGWNSPHALPVTGPGVEISFATSQPSAGLFPIDDIRQASAKVMADDGATILQLGSPSGYPPLRKLLMNSARNKGIARPTDEIIVTNGCQQGIDLLQRVLVSPGDTVAVEDPVYPGIHHVLNRAGARVVGLPIGENGLDAAELRRVLEREKPRLLVVTPDFQNPTGTTLPLEGRHILLQAARQAGTVVAENDIYTDLRYKGTELPSLKQLDEYGDVIQIKSFSKIAFPGLRVGWIIAPQPVIARLTEAKQWCDLHTDQLSQALLCRFAESGSLEAHRRRVIEGGRERLAATLEACEKHMPEGSRFTRPEGGMNLWIELPAGLDTGELLSHAQSRGVSYLPGRYFAVSRSHAGSLRLSFAGLTTEKITRGITILGDLFRAESNRARRAPQFESAPAMV